MATLIPPLLYPIPYPYHSINDIPYPTCTPIKPVIHFSFTWMEPHAHDHFYFTLFSTFTPIYPSTSHTLHVPTPPFIPTIHPNHFHFISITFHVLEVSYTWPSPISFLFIFIPILSIFMPVVSTASYFFYPHIHHFLLHPVIHLMTLHILHNTHVYHHPPIPILFTFFLTTFSLFTPRHVLHFFLPLHGHAWPHHTHISYPPCISSPSNTQLTHFLSHHLFSLCTTPHTHFFFKCPSNSFPSPLHGHAWLC